jgi:hypothetical protein
MRILATIIGEGFACDIREDLGRSVEYIADGDIDADGANGQNGQRAAYMLNNAGSEDLRNGGMRMSQGRVIGAEDWWKDIVLEGPDGFPMVVKGGIIPSRTSYRFPNKRRDDPAAYVDAETVPYIVVPPVVIQKTAGAVLGCRAKATNLDNGKSYMGIVADVGPRTKVGELSIAMAREIGLPFNPRTGGTEKPRIKYELWPGIAGSIDGVPVVLQRSNGTYVD